MAIAANGLVLVPAYRGLYALNPNDGSPAWTATYGSSATSPLVGSDGTVYGASSTGVQALDPTTGASRWTVPLAATGASPLALSESGTLYVTGGGSVGAVR